MKRIQIFFAGALLVAMAFSARAGSRDDLWRQVDDAVKKGLPQTAITHLEPIISGALKDKAYPEAAKAIAKKIVLEGDIQGNKPEERITRMETEIARAPQELQPVLETLLAHWYWQYFQANQWRFIQRTATAEPPGKDFTTWDLPRIYAEIDRHLKLSLAAAPILKATPIGAWDDLVEKGTMPDSYRPTLYDFLVWQALEFYTSGEQAGARPETTFDLSADSPVFQPVPEFVSWVNGLPDETNEPVVTGLKLYRDLLLFHQNDPAPNPAFASADLERLTFGWNEAFGEDKNARYKAALERFIHDHADSDISAFATEREARVIQQEGDLVHARAMADAAARRFPDSTAGKVCRNLVLEIESKAASIATERIWNAPWPKITVTYKNVGLLHFRAIPVDWTLFLNGNFHGQNWMWNDADRRKILDIAPALTWSAKLPPPPNFNYTNFEVSAPDTLKPGYYFIAASYNDNVAQDGNFVTMTPICVSDLALVRRPRDGNLEGFVLEANSGEPAPGAVISIWHFDGTGKPIAEPEVQADTNGFFSCKFTQYWNLLVRARQNGREVGTTSDSWWPWSSSANPQPYATTVFFTDRSLYRPGQIIQFKGICAWVDAIKNDYHVLPGEAVTVVFTDSNGKEIARQNLRANDYGSISGSFTAPRDRLMGRMQITTEGRAAGNAWFNVEEYKRPKFEVTLDAPKTAAKLNESVSLTGHATAYTGAAVDDAQVRYRVVRDVRMPWWWGWWNRGPQRGSQEIAHGTLRTQTDGSFKIEFTAKPDLAVLEKDEPTFYYEITADVTDGAGETRSASHGVLVGYTALQATLQADDWQTGGKPVEITVGTKTLDGEPQTAEGNLKIYQLQAPDKVQRPYLDGEDTATDLSDPNHWPLGPVAAEQAFTTETNGIKKLSFALPEGFYRAMLETQDRFGKHVTARLPLRVLRPDDTKCALKIPSFLAAPAWELQPGQDFTAVWGTGYETGRAFVEIENRNQIIRRFWTDPGRTQQRIKVAVTEAMRGGFNLRVTQVRENRAYCEARQISVPWKNKELTLTWEHFTSKLQPGQKDNWTAVIKGPDAEKSTAEMVAALYDESLDQFLPHRWQSGFGFFYQNAWPQSADFLNATAQFNQIYNFWNSGYEGVSITYRHFPDDLMARSWPVFYAFAARGGGIGGGGGGMAVNGAVALGALLDRREMRKAPAGKPADGMEIDDLFDADKSEAGESPARAQPPGPPIPDLGTVTARKNLTETAFFFPHLLSDSDGTVKMSFTMPEAVTKWHFLGFAHDKELRGGLLEGHTFTAKDIMVQPNPPRFLREGDTVEFTVKVSNQSDQSQQGRVRLTFASLADEQSVDALLRNTRPEQSFDIPAKESRSFAWRITVPDGAPFLSYKAVAATSGFSDGEEGGVPVLSRRIFVTESLPLAIRGPATNKFEFKKLVDSAKSKTLQNEGVTVEMTSHPAWYAVLALPYLMEYPYECSEQTFNRLYANALARHIANADPKIRAIFEQWKNTPALDSPLEKDQDLKSVLIEETPWLRQANNESQARRNVGIIFDNNRLDSETEATLQRLTDMQLSDGRWPWFPGGPANDFITLYIVTGFGRLRHLGAEVSIAPAVRALARLDAWATERYDEIQKTPNPENYVPGYMEALYLYGRSFFLTDVPVAPANRVAVDFFLAQSRKNWLATGCRQSQAQIALALHRIGGTENLAVAQAILRSLKERAVTNSEMGMFWRDTEESWWWYRAPIETQALMIEAFDEVADDPAAVEDCRVWLLKQKQTQDWRTTKATADAIYALLLRGAKLLSSTALTEVTVGGANVTPPRGGNPSSSAKAAEDRQSALSSEALAKEEIRNSVEPGTGFYEVKFSPGEVKPRMGEITVKKSDSGIAWGSVHWQYLEDISKVTPNEATPLKLKKSLFVKVNTPRGQVLEPIKGPVSVGDELVVRLELRTDRDMEYVHLKDQRASGTEPVNVLSRYKYQDGLVYYESTRDTATHFFIDYLPKGTYVFEYSARVQLRGEYQTGIAEIQCMYAPEFNSHSESLPISVK